MSANVRSLVNLGSLASLSVLSLAACDQPAPKCSMQRGEFMAQYTLVSGTGECSTLTGEGINVGVYGTPSTGDDMRPDPNRVIIGLEPQSLVEYLGSAAGLADANPEDNAYALGEFAKSEPDSDDFCVVPSFRSAARVRLPMIAADVDEAGAPIPEQPAVDVMYEWSNVRVYATAGAFGTQFAATLKYTKDGCSAEYRVSAIYPKVSCEAVPPETDEAPATGDDAGLSDGAIQDASVPQGMDASSDIDAGGLGDDAGDETTDDAGEESDASEDPGEPAPAPVLDESLCSPYPNTMTGFVGSGINPSFATRCDPVLLHCVLSKEPPSLR